MTIWHRIFKLSILISPYIDKSVFPIKVQKVHHSESSKNEILEVCQNWIRQYLSTKIIIKIIFAKYSIQIILQKIFFWFFCIKKRYRKRLENYHHSCKILTKLKFCKNDWDSIAINISHENLVNNFWSLSKITLLQ